MDLIFVQSTEAQQVQALQKFPLVQPKTFPLEICQNRLQVTVCLFGICVEIFINIYKIVTYLLTTNPVPKQFSRSNFLKLINSLDISNSQKRFI